MSEIYVLKDIMMIDFPSIILMICVEHDSFIIFDKSEKCSFIFYKQSCISIKTSRLSVESQKGVNAVWQCSVVKHIGAIAVKSLNALAPFWLSVEVMEHVVLHIVNALLVLDRHTQFLWHISFWEMFEGPTFNVFILQ